MYSCLDRAKKQFILGFGIFEEVHSSPFKALKIDSNLQWIPTFNGHSLTPRLDDDLGPFSTAESIDFRLWFFRKSPLQA